MSTTKHTAEPWKTGARHPGRVIAGNAVVYCTSPQDEGSETEEEKERAARIVACVNACAGMEDPDLSLRHAKSVLQTVAQCSENIDLRKHAAEALRALGG